MTAKRFRLKSWTPSEGHVQSAILEALAFECAQGRVSWYGRFNCGRLWVPGSRQDDSWYSAIKYWINGVEYRKGFPDIAGMLTDGRFFLLEVKKPNVKRGTAEQHGFSDHATAHGAVGGIVRSADEAINVIRGAFSLQPQR